MPAVTILALVLPIFPAAPLVLAQIIQLLVRSANALRVVLLHLHLHLPISTWHTSPITLTFSQA